MTGDGEETTPCLAITVEAYQAALVLIETMTHGESGVLAEIGQICRGAIDRHGVPWLTSATLAAAICEDLPAAVQALAALTPPRREAPT